MGAEGGPNGQPISVSAATAWATFLSVAYVAVLYVDKTHRIGQRSYTDPAVIRHRLVVASATTVTEVVLTLLLVGGTKRAGGSALTEAFRFALTELGLCFPIQSGFVSVLVSLSLTALMYVAQLVNEFLQKELPGQANASRGRFVNPFSSPSSLRTFVVGPLTEELVFRAAVLAPFAASPAGKLCTLFLTPTFFALAHVHHACEIYLDNGRTRQAAIRGLQTALVQVVYTFLFGWYANWLFLRSGTVLAPLAAHILCNYFGLPLPCSTSHKTVLLVLQLAGIVAFGCLVVPLTSPRTLGLHTLWA